MREFMRTSEPVGKMGGGLFNAGCAVVRKKGIVLIRQSSREKLVLSHDLRPVCTRMNRAFQVELRIR